MRKSLTVATSIIACFLSTNAAAYEFDHLLPEQSIFTNIYFEESYSLISERLGRMSGLYTFASAVVFPSFSREYVIAFEEKDSNYVLVCMKTEIPLGLYQQQSDLKEGRLRISPQSEHNKRLDELEELLPEDVYDVKAHVQEINLNESLGRQIYSVWGRMLYQTRYPLPEEKIEQGTYAPFGGGYDGTNYHFAFFHNHQPLSGWTWSPDSDTLPGILVEVTREAKAACDSEDKSTVILAEKVDLLEQALNDREMENR